MKKKININKSNIDALFDFARDNNLPIFIMPNSGYDNLGMVVACDSEGNITQLRFEKKGTMPLDLSAIPMMQKLEALELGGPNLSEADFNYIREFFFAEPNFSGWERMSVKTPRDIQEITHGEPLSSIYAKQPNIITIERGLGGRRNRDGDVIDPQDEKVLLDFLSEQKIKIPDLQGLLGVCNWNSKGKITYLNLPKKGIDSIALLAPLSSIEVLDLAWNPIRSLSGISFFSRLRQLSIGLSKCPDWILYTKSLKNLTHLTIDEDSIDDLSPLESLTNLMSLDVSDNEVWDLSPLAGMTKLRFLNLDKTRVRDISILFTLPELEEFSAYDSKIDIEDEEYQKLQRLCEERQEGEEW